MQVIERQDDARDRHVAVVVSTYNDFVTSRLEAGALAALSEAGVAGSAITIVRVPGAFEIPSAARQAAGTGRFHAVVCLGCVIRGETPHFEYIASAVAHGLVAVAADTNVPVTFGVLTTNSVEEALARAGDGPDNKGREAARAALAMASVFHQLGGRL